MKISERLKHVASFVSDNSHVIDVGCDHALLDIYLALNKKNIEIVATDVKEGPLKKAMDNISFYQVSDLISLELGDGLDRIKKNTDTIVISGLGGESIINILKKGNLINIKNIILSPQSDIPKVRKYLNSINFKIEDEEIVYDYNKPYIIIKYVPGKEILKENDYYFGPILLKNKNQLFIKYYQTLLDTKLEIIKGISMTNPNYNNLKLEIEKLENELNI